MSAIASSYINSNSSNQVLSFQKVDKNPDFSLQSRPLNGRNNIPVENQITSRKEAAYQEIYLSLPAELDHFYPLLRAVLASGKPRLFSITTDGQREGFILKYDAVQEAAVQGYLSQVFNLIREEARFKTLLRKVMVNQQKYQREESLLFAELSKS